jgi:hypothetical protein
MSLLSFQNALAISLRDNQPGPLEESAGLRLTRSIRRSWCEGRSAKAARLTLMVLPPARRRELVAAWVDQGGGTSSFFAKEGEAFLDFIFPMLPEASYARSVCRFEQAVLRASDAADNFAPPEEFALLAADITLQRHQSSSLITFAGDPATLFSALERGTEPQSVSCNRVPLLVAPGLPGLCRLATTAEVALLDRLATPVELTELLAEAHALPTINGLVYVGAIEPR